MMKLSHPGTGIWILLTYVIGGVAVLFVMLAIAGFTLDWW